MSFSQSLRPYRWFVGLVIVPSLLVGMYEGLIASGQYVSESRIIVKSAAGSAVQPSGIAALLSGSVTGSAQESGHEVEDFIRSRDAMGRLEKLVPLRKLYGRDGVDPLSRYPSLFSDDAEENLFRYYGKKVHVKTDGETGLTVLSADAFTADDAQKINATLLELSEDLVNRLNDRVRSRAIVEAEKRVAQAEARIRAGRRALGAYRNSERIIDPAKQATGVLDVANKLVSERASLRAQLEQMQKSAPLNPALPALAGRVAALDDEIGAQNGRATGTSTGLASKLGQYESLSLEQEFAAQNLTAANAALEGARANAQKQQFYIERVVEPNKPDLPLLPSRLFITLTVAGVLACLYLVGWMLVVGILEHAPED